MKSQTPIYHTLFTLLVTIAGCIILGIFTYVLTYVFPAFMTDSIYVIGMIGIVLYAIIMTYACLKEVWGIPLPKIPNFRR